jgi:hypothetical protein
LKWGTKFSNRDNLHLVYKPDDSNNVIGKGKLMEHVQIMTSEKVDRPVEARINFQLSTTEADTIVFADLPRNFEDPLRTTRQQKDHPRLCTRSLRPSLSVHIFGVPSNRH